MKSFVCFSWAALAATVLFSGIPVAHAAVASIPAAHDNSMMEDSLGESCGVGNLYSGETRQFGSRRALIRFDIAGELPPGSTINSAELRLTVLRAGFNASATDVYRLHRVTANWGESSGAGASECFGGSGASAATGDATWSHRLWPSTTWTTPGGDFAATPSGSAATSIAGAAAWPSQPGLVADVQSWLDSPGGNFGWIIIGEESLPTTAREFSSREGGSPPELVVDYTAAPATTPPEVPDGRVAPPLRVNKLSANGSDLELFWDTAHCTVNPDHNIVYGTRSNFPASMGGTYGLQGVLCAPVGSSPFSWIGSPDPAVLDPGSRLLWMLVIANDANGNEGSWGRRTPFQERVGPGPNGSSNACGISNKILTNLCGQDF